MDGKSSGGFRISAREVDFGTPPEEVSSSRGDSISCLPNSALAADPSSLQKAFSESIANNDGPQLCGRGDFNRSSAESNTPMEIADDKNSQYSTGATVMYSAPTGDSFAAASSGNAEGRSSELIGFNSRPTRGSTSAAADSRLSANSTTPKVGKKRSRASRRAPTTVLTTDTSNFRAMVQEFTGIPTSPFSSAPFPRHGIDFLGVPGSAGLPAFLPRRFPHHTSMPPINNYGPFPGLPSSTPPPTSYFMQSVMQAQRPPKDSIPLPASSNFINAEELGLNVALPDLVSSDGRPHARTSDGSTRENTMNNNNTKVGGGGGRAFDRRFSSDGSAGRNPPRPDRGMIDSWINSPLHIQSPDKDNAAQ